jgi:hypothetical protein
MASIQSSILLQFDLNANFKLWLYMGFPREFTLISWKDRSRTKNWRVVWRLHMHFGFNMPLSIFNLQQWNSIRKWGIPCYLNVWIFLSWVFFHFSYLSFVFILYFLCKLFIGLWLCLLWTKSWNPWFDFFYICSLYAWCTRRFFFKTQNA